jgi:3'(2'), 5'-bisphosphate nucleotidase
MNNAVELNIQLLLDTAKKAALLAGKQIIEVYNSDDFGVETKSDESPLTKADQAAHTIIEALLASTNLPILSEEGKSISYEERKSWDCFWMVDPLDGTKEFIKRNGEFTVNIALIKNGVPILGVVYTPVTDELFYAHKSIGAFKEIGVEVRKLSRLNSLNLENLRVVASRSHLNDQTKTFINKLIDPTIVSMGSSLKFLALADNKADVYPRFAPTMEWDSAAAHAICSVLGIEVLDVGTQKPLAYNKENLLNPFFIVASSSLITKLSLK